MSAEQAALTATDAAIKDQVRRLKSAMAQDILESEVASWPPLSASQRDRLAVLLRGDAA